MHMHKNDSVQLQIISVKHTLQHLNLSIASFNLVYVFHDYNFRQDARTVYAGI